MALDFEKLKQNLSADNLKNVFSKSPTARDSHFGHSEKWAKFKSGLLDIKVVLEEKKFSLFVKQFVVVAAVFLLVKTVNGKLVAHETELKDKMSALSIQQTNKEEYLNNKEHLLRLEQLFPNVDQKSSWMPSVLMAWFDKHDLSPKLDGNFAENSQKMYTVVSQADSWQQGYRELGKMLAGLENGDDFVRVSEVSVSKLTDKDNLGFNGVTVKFNTIFPLEKYAPKLFKDYAQQMEKIKAQQQPKVAPATNQAEANK